MDYQITNWPMKWEACRGLGTEERGEKERKEGARGPKKGGKRTKKTRASNQIKEGRLEEKKKRTEESYLPEH